MGIKVLFIYPNNPGMILPPPALALFSAILKKEGIGLIALLNYYIQEFYFNLKLIVNDLAKLIHQVINL